ncbi:MAG: TIGR03759 family integrating conjugative element protein [Methylococcaceae bacterium]
MNQYSICFLLILFSLLLNPVIATETKEKQLEHTLSKNKALGETKIRRKQWSLSEAEWTRYKQLMKGIRGSISPKNISPIEVLGTHARSDEERRKYAELWARMLHDDVEKTLAFQFAYNKATALLYPNEKIIDTSLLGLTDNSVFKPNDRILVFLKTEPCEKCNETLRKVMNDDMTKDLHIDIYFTDTNSKKDNNKIRAWAKQHSIDAKRLKSGGITLNHDQGTLFKLTKKAINSVPLVFSYHSKKLTRIQY